MNSTPNTVNTVLNQTATDEQRRARAREGVGTLVRHTRRVTSPTSARTPGEQVEQWCCVWAGWTPVEVWRHRRAAGAHENADRATLSLDRVWTVEDATVHEHLSCEPLDAGGLPVHSTATFATPGECLSAALAPVD